MEKQEKEKVSGHKSFHAQTAEEVLSQLNVELAQGLSETSSSRLEGWIVIVSLSLVPVLLGAFLPGIRFYSAKNN